MAFPNPTTAPDAFRSYLDNLQLGVAVNVFIHYRTRPDPRNGRLAETVVQNWCERMDLLQVSSKDDYHPTIAEHFEGETHPPRQGIA
jgi:hypothetical protein